jgi:Uri superfamily endonuclease
MVVVNIAWIVWCTICAIAVIYLVSNHIKFIRTVRYFVTGVVKEITYHVVDTFGVSHTVTRTGEILNDYRWHDDFIINKYEPCSSSIFANALEHGITTDTGNHVRVASIREGETKYKASSWKYEHSKLFGWADGVSVKEKDELPVNIRVE